MPKSEIDYSNTIIYKLVCKDNTINDVYVGHTTNFIKRKYHHKACYQNLSKKLKIYDIIRANGGWNNWDMVLVSSYNCKNAKEARTKEQYHYEYIKLQTKYNSSNDENTNKNNNFINLSCEKKYNSTTNEFISNNNFDVNNTKKNYGKDDAEDRQMSQKFSKKSYDCIESQKSEMYANKTAPKQKMDYKDDVLEDILDDADVSFSPMQYICNCGKSYIHRQGLWKHKKICNIINSKENTNNNNINQNNDIKNLTNLVLDVVKQNQELTNKIVDICKTGQTITNNNINSHNKTFNLNVFLNETCKDAMNIMDFVDSLKIQLTDLENVGKLGYVEGISNIIVKNLKALDIHKRPVHCSDSKREVMYIKDENKWEKENEEKNKLRKIIKKIANKNSRLLPQFKEKHPDCGKSDSPFSDQYNKLIIEAMGGSGDNDLEKEDKIIRKIAKEVTIDKSIEY
jgi:hypothetical protein